MTDLQTASAHSLYSSYREMLVEHLLAAQIMRYLWRRGNVRMEVLKPQVDDGGYDLVLEANDIVRHVQLKASHAEAKTSRVNVSKALARRPSGCVVWCIFDEETMDFESFLWFGGRPGRPLFSLNSYPTARHTKANAKGEKGARPNLRCVPRTAFKRLDGIGDLVRALFGPPTAP